MSGRPTKLPDGSYTSKSDGHTITVKGGMAYRDEAPQAQAQGNPFDAPGAQAALTQQQEGFDLASGVNGERKRDAFLNAGTLGAYGAVGMGGDPEEAARKEPGYAMAGAVASPANKLPGGGGFLGGVARTGIRAAGGANYADTVGQNPLLGGLVGGAMGAFGEASSGVGNFMGKVGPWLKNQFGPAAAVLPAVKGTLAKTVGNTAQTMAIPVAEAVSAAKSLEEEEARVQAAERAGITR